MSSLTKKQQKAAAFKAKAKGKGKKDVVPADLPEEDVMEVDEVIEPQPEIKGKKRKREVDGDVLGQEKKKDIGKGKTKSGDGWVEDEQEEGIEGKKKSKKDVKQRFILFVGNLSYKTSREAIQEHFKPAIERIPSVRLLTEKPKPGKPAGPTKSRGIAFLELDSSSELQACLKLHHSILQNRQINVELTAGGGGKSQERKGKIRQRNERVGGQRERRKEREGEMEDEVQPDIEVSRPSGSEGKVGGDVKVRGGRRVKTTSEKSDKGGESQRVGNGHSRYPNNRQERRPNSKFVPTGANALVVS
ncbi:hypothetical protein M231_01098 [Tremella mesenterica]|uniref:RRM domain-containing protein n=1 Tax=Tremella mesenterica TaxID=5217 RepID=A0A4Q1BU30_TREME|nr:hypothetical protein M231_01098 [Tremella mesenterica]